MAPTHKNNHNINNNNSDHHPDKPSSWFFTCFGYCPTPTEPTNKRIVKRSLGSSSSFRDDKKRNKRRFWKFSCPVVRIRVMMKRSSSSLNSSTSNSRKRDKEMKAVNKTRRRCLRWVHVGTKGTVKVGGEGSSGGDHRLQGQDVMIASQHSVPFAKVEVVEQTSRPACWLSDGDDPIDIHQTAAVITTKLRTNLQTINDTDRPDCTKQVENGSCSRTSYSVLQSEVSNPRAKDVEKRRRHSRKNNKPKPDTHPSDNKRLKQTATESSAPSKMIEVDYVNGMSILMVTLTVMVSCGRLCAMFCTVVWFYCLPRLSRRANTAALLIIDSR